MLDLLAADFLRQQLDALAIGNSERCIRSGQCQHDADLDVGLCGSRERNEGCGTTPKPSVS